MVQQRERRTRGLVRPVSIAPMMQRTDRHFRVMMRAMTQHTLLYTEMVTTGAILHGDRARHLGYNPIEKPLALQVGGDDPKQLRACARIAEDLGYDEVNLNVGCPSDRVQKGRFGACLMAEPHRVADAIAAMRAEVAIPVTVKHRIGIDSLDRYEDMLNFVDVVSQAQADRFSVHARKAWLSGLSPKENRTVPPLRYEDVYRLKRERPREVVEINGGVLTTESIETHLAQVDAVMIGRAAYENPLLFQGVDGRFFAHAGGRERSIPEIISTIVDYAERHLERGERLHHVTRHMMGFFVGWKGSKRWRRILSQAPSMPSADTTLIRDAYSALSHFHPQLTES
ncbi:MAG: tRNA dihydrouridine(20/20a) synthase DusA [Myxococcota bacterium]|nr:tRNA dihydrouridine(20/20a) synthase DusA [Myxococcota bacterium]